MKNKGNDKIVALLLNLGALLPILCKLFDLLQI